LTLKKKSILNGSIDPIGQKVIVFAIEELSDFDVQTELINFYGSNPVLIFKKMIDNLEERIKVDNEIIKQLKFEISSILELINLYTEMKILK